MAQHSAGLDRRVVTAAAAALQGAGSVITPSAEAATALVATGIAATVTDLDTAPRGAADAVALIAGELSEAGEHGESLINTAVQAIRPGGVIAVSARSVTSSPTPGSQPYTAADLHRALGHRGVGVGLLCAPGAAALVGGDPDGDYDPERDRLPGLLDAAPRLLAVGRVARSAAERSNHFFATLPQKVVAAAVLCRNAQGQLLVVHDSFKQHWTIPGGVVDANEDPRSAAVREAWEEAGVRVDAGAVLGVFSALWPDRLIVIYAAEIVVGADHRFTPLHAHEIDAVTWMDLDEALRTLAPHMAQQVRACLDEPGGTVAAGMA